MSPPARFLLAAGLAALLAPRAALADPPAKQVAGGAAHGAAEDAARQASRINDEATALYEKGRYRDAIARLEAARALDPTAKDLVYNQAVIHEKLGDLEAAEDLYRRFLAMEDDPRGQERIRAILRRVQGARREIAHAKRPGDGAPSAAPPPAPPPARTPTSRWVIATASIAGGTFVLGTIFGVSAMVQNPGPEARTSARVSIDDLKHDAASAHRSAVLADVSFAISAASAATALLLHFFAPRGALGATRAGAQFALGNAHGAGRAERIGFALLPGGTGVMVRF